MKLRNGKKMKILSSYWWFPYIKRRHSHSSRCFCQNNYSIKQWLQMEEKSAYQIYNLSDLATEIETISEDIIDLR